MVWRDLNGNVLYRRQAASMSAHMAIPIAKQAGMMALQYGIERGLKRLRTEQKQEPGELALNTTTAPNRLVFANKYESRRHKRMRQRMAKRRLKDELSFAPVMTFQRITNTILTPAAGAQTMGFLTPIYTNKNYGAINGDIWDILKDVERLAITNLPLPTQPPLTSANPTRGYKLHFQSAKQVVEVINLQTALVAYCDLYEYYCTTDIPYLSFNTLFATQAGIGFATGVQSTTLNATPFDFDQVVNAIHIVKCTKMVLPPSSSQEFTWGDFKPKTFNGDKYNLDLEGAPNREAGLAGWTKGILAVVTGQGDLNNNSAALATGVKFITTNRYKLKVLVDEYLQPLPVTASL